MKIWALLLAVAVLLVACDEEDDVKVETPPLGIRSTFPVDADSSDSPDDYSGVVDLTVTFDREVSASLFSSELVPAAVNTGIWRTPDRRTWTLHDVELEASTGVYFLLIDALDMPIPNLLRIRTQPRTRFNGFAGRVESRNPAVDPRGTVIFALPRDTSFNPLSPGSFADTTPLAIAIANYDDDDEPLYENYWLGYQVFRDVFVVVAIKDTNGDLEYDPRADWWGYYKNGSGLSFVEVGTWQSEGTEPVFNEIVDIVLQQPVPDPELP